MDPHAPYERATPWIDAVQKHTKPHISAYKSEIRRVDEHIRKLFKQKLWKEDALIIFLADHGEAFGEHDATGHGKNLHTEVVRVPFFIAHPKLKPRRIRQVVHTADILPTLADIFGWQSDENWQGESLLTQEAYGRPIFSELLRPQEHPRTSEESVITNNYQLIVAGTNNADMRLYNIREDLDQNNNLVNETGSGPENAEASCSPPRDITSRWRRDGYQNGFRGARAPKNVRVPPIGAGQRV